jgi:hypothetical protein
MMRLHGTPKSPASLSARSELLRRALIRGVVAGCLGAAVVSTTTGCGRDETICEPEVPAGRILGHVRTGGLPFVATVSAVRLVDGIAAVQPFETETDSTGYYCFDLPAGRYVLKVRPSSIWPYREYFGTVSGRVADTPDTLLVDASRVATRLDFELAGLTFDLGLSHALDGEMGRIILHRRSVSGEAASADLAEASAEIADGRLFLRVPGILPGDYQIEVELGYRQYMCFCPYDGEHLWLPGTRDRADSPWYALAPDSLVTLACQLAAEPAWLSGRVTGAWQTMGLDAAIELAIVTPDSVTVVGQRQLLSDDGSFAVPLHVAGPVKLVVRQHGVAYWVGGPSFAAATTFALEPGQSITGVEIVQSGLRIDVDGPSPYLAGAAFELYDATGRELVTTAVVRIGQEGQIGIANLWPGRYLLRVRHEHGFIDGFASSSEDRPSWRPQWFDRATDVAGAQWLEIGQAGQVVPIRLTLERGGVISGSVELPFDGDRSYGYVYATAADNFSTLDRAFAWSSQGNPTFAVTGLADGDYKLGVCPTELVGDEGGPPPDATVWYPGTMDWAAAGTFTIVDGGTLADVVLRLP